MLLNNENTGRIHWRSSSLVPPVCKNLQWKQTPFSNFVVGNLKANLLIVTCSKCLEVMKKKPKESEESKLHWVIPTATVEKYQLPVERSWLKGITACGRKMANCRTLHQVSRLVLEQKLTCKTCLKLAETLLGDKK